MFHRPFIICSISEYSLHQMSISMVVLIFHGFLNNRLPIICPNSDSIHAIKLPGICHNLKNQLWQILFGGGCIGMDRMRTNNPGPNIQESVKTSITNYKARPAPAQGSSKFCVTTFYLNYLVVFSLAWRTLLFKQLISHSWNYSLTKGNI